LDFSKGLVGRYDELFGVGIEDNERGERSGFGRKWGWYQSINHLAGEDLLRFDAITKLPIHTVLTKLSYDKEKADIESREMKRRMKK
jgi:hypothetical protein